MKNLIATKDWFIPAEAQTIPDFDLGTLPGAIVHSKFYPTDRNVLTILPTYDVDLECFQEYLPYMLDYNLLANSTDLKQIIKHVKEVTTVLYDKGLIIKYRKKVRDSQ